MAEGVGFEPTMVLLPCRFSKPVLLATQSPFHNKIGASGESRTRTPFRALPPQDSVSAIPPRTLKNLQKNDIDFFQPILLYT